MSANQTDDDLVNRLRRASQAVYLATNETVANDISSLLKEAARTIEIERSRRGMGVEEKRNTG